MTVIHIDESIITKNKLVILSLSLLLNILIVIIRDRIPIKIIQFCTTIVQFIFKGGATKE